MHPIEIENCLSTMKILVDTREQPSERATQRYEQFACSYRRQKLRSGDYSAEYIDSDNELQRLNVYIERKMSLDELATCFGRERKRFTAEFDRAMAEGSKMYLLVEDATWENLINGKYKSQLKPKAFFASITTFMARYNIVPIFCKKEISGKIISEILYRELRATLENGLYG